MPTFGAIKSPADPRDYMYSKLIAPTATPAKFLLEEFAVRDQGQYGTCVGQAAAGIKDWQEKKNYGRTIETSPLFVYSECKKIDGIPTQEGTYPKSAFQVLSRKGICKESTFPYTNASKTPTDPPQQAVNEAKEFIIGAYAQTQTLAEVKQAIMRDGPVMGAVLVCDNFTLPEPGGFVPMPGGYILGGHAIVVTGWDDTLKHTYKQSFRGKSTFQGFLRVRNSWGNGWGDNGYCWIPYDFFTFRDDLGMPYWMESWSSVDVLMPVPSAKQIVLEIGKAYVYVDGDRIPLDQPATIDPKTNRTVIPLRFVAEQMGWLVDYRDRKITLTKPEV